MTDVSNPEETFETLSPSSRNGLWERLTKLEELRASGRDPFPHFSFSGRKDIASCVAEGVPAEWDVADGDAVAAQRIAGRITRRRKHGKIFFADLRDESGAIELVFRSDLMGELAYGRAQELEVGDIVSVEGVLILSRRGETMIRVGEFELLAKSLRQPPTDRPHKGGVSIAHANRELDLLTSEQTRDMFRMRAKTTSALRGAMDGHGFIEVETPILQNLAGGAHAKPFITQANSLARHLSLRISAELYIRRCVIGGLERVYDLGKCFRNEGISHRHSPEFTMIEWSMCYTDYRDVATFTEQLISEVALAVLATPEVERRGRTIDLAPPWRRLSVQEAILETVGVDCMKAERAELVEILDEPGEAPESWGGAVNALYAKYVESTLIDPTIVFDFPIESYPLVKRHREHPALAEAFDVVIDGLEVASGDTELNDPEEQESRFLEQAERDLGDGKAHPHDAQYVRALEYGVPPSAGAGIGLERLLLVFSGSEAIRDVIPFPALSGRR
jgi:lysyl-tRNA synthetase class 2